MRALVGDRELRQTVDLVAPQVDAHRVVGRRGIDVDDRTAHRELAARLDLVLAAVAHRDEPLDELVAVELRAGRDDDRLDVLDVRPEALHERADRRDDHVRQVIAARRASRHMTRSRRPIVSVAGETRSNGSVSHAGNSSTASSPRYCRRSPATRSASARVGTASNTGRRAVAPASVAVKMARAGSGTATV